MYILNIANTIKKMSVNETKNLSLKTIINELDFLRETILLNETLY